MMLNVNDFISKMGLTAYEDQLFLGEEVSEVDTSRIFSIKDATFGLHNLITVGSYREFGLQLAQAFLDGQLDEKKLISEVFFYGYFDRRRGLVTSADETSAPVFEGSRVGNVADIVKCVLRVE